MKYPRVKGPGDMEDRRRKGSVGPHWQKYEDGSGHTMLDLLLIELRKQRALKNEFIPNTPIIFPADTPLGRLQRAAGVKPSDSWYAP